MRAFWRRLSAPECRHCRKPATWQSKFNGDWLCDDCSPCWCNWCHGRVGVHGAEAVTQYRQEAEAAVRLSEIAASEPPAVS